MIKCAEDQCAFGRRFVGVGGDPSAPLAFLGEAPGRQELKNGEPFVGAAGKTLRKECEIAGIDWNETFRFNACCCLDLTRDSPKPTIEELEACHDLLIEHIKLSKAKLICCLGGTSQGEMIPGLRISLARGKFRAVKIGEEVRVFTSTYHPAAILRGNQQYLELFREDLQRVRKYLG